MSTTEQRARPRPRAPQRRRVLDGEPRARLERPLAHPADRAPRARARRTAAAPGRRACRRGRRRGRPRAGSTTDIGGTRRVELAVGASRRARRASAGRTAARRPRRPARHDAARDLARVAAVVVVLVGHRPDHPLHGEAAVVQVPVAGELDRLEVLEQRRPVVPRHRVACPSTTLSPRSADSGIARRSCIAELLREPRAARPRSRGSAPREKSTRSILFTATTTCGIAEHRGDVGRAGASARATPRARVEQDHARGRRSRRR